MTDKLWDGHDLSEYDPRLKPHLVVVTLLVVLEHGHAEPGREAQEEAFSCISYGSPRGRGRRHTGWSGGTHPTRRSWCHPRTLTTMLILRLSILLTPGPHSDSDRFCQNSRDSATELILLCMVTSNCNLLLNIHPEINKVKSLPSFLYIVWIWPLSSRSC